MEIEALLLIIVSSMACFAAVGGWLAQLKNHPPLEGVILGALLGPIGLLVLVRMRVAHRPMVDRGAWNSFRSMVDYQSDPAMLQLTDATTRSKR